MMKGFLAGVLVVAIAVITWKAFQLESRAAVYPLTVSVGALISFVALLILQLFSRRALARIEGLPSVPVSVLARVSTFVAVWVLYVLVLPTLGFLVATWAALVVTLAIAGRRLSVGVILSTGVFVAVLSILTKTVLYVPVPAALPDEYLETLLYRML